MYSAKIRLLIPLSIVACNDDKAPDSSPDTESPYAFKDTGLAPESTPPEETAETAQETDSPLIDTHDTGDPGPDPLQALNLYPADLAVHPGATWNLRLVADDADWIRSDVDFKEVKLTSDDSKIATVAADGTVTAVSVGQTSLRAWYGGAEATADITVLKEGTAEITVVDYDSGAPVEGARASMNGGKRVTTDAHGYALVETDDTGMLSFHAWSDDHAPATIVSTVARRLVVPIRDLESAAAEGVDITGDVDWSGVSSGGADDVQVGLTSASLYVHPISFGIEDLLGDDRKVTWYGIDINLPGNLYIEGTADDYQARAEPGEFGMWSMAGPVPYADILSAAAGLYSPIDVMADNLANFSFGWDGGYEGAGGEELSIDIAPAEPFTDYVAVTVPELSLGFSGDEQPLLLLADETPVGNYAIVGLGQGIGDVLALRATPGVIAGSGESWALAVAQVDDLGSGYGMALSAGRVEASFAELPEFQQIPSLDYFTGDPREYSLTSDERAQLLRLTIVAKDGSVQDLYLAGGATSGEFPKVECSFGYGNTDWSLRSMELSADTFEGLTASGRVRDEDLADTILTAATVTQNFTGT